MAENDAPTEREEPQKLEDRTYRFALRVVKLCIKLQEQPGTKRSIAQQLLRSGTSIGANYEESQAAATRAEFRYKVTISLREARETRYWLRLLTDAGLVEPRLIGPLLDEATQLMKILGAIAAKCRKTESPT